MNICRVLCTYLPPSAMMTINQMLGALEGIGACLSRRLVAGSKRLKIATRSVERVYELSDELQVPAYPLESINFPEVDAFVNKAIELQGRLDGVANCVGSLLHKSAYTTTEAECSAFIAQNLTTAVATVRSAAKAMLTQGGLIVLVSSAV